MHVASHRPPRRRGSAMLEFIVVVAIISALLSLFLPALLHSLEASRKVRCTNNFRQAAIAMGNHHDTHQQFPPGWSGPAQRDLSGWAWSAYLLSFAEQRRLADGIAWEEKVDAPLFAGTLEEQLAMLTCPSSRLSDELVTLRSPNGKRLRAKMASSSMVGNFGAKPCEPCVRTRLVEDCTGDGMFYWNSRLTLRHIHDGGSQTLLLGERGDAPVRAVWAGVYPGELHGPGRVVGSAATPPNTGQSPYEFSSEHPLGFNTMFADGSVRFLSNRIEPSVFRAAATRDGNELARLTER